MIDIDEYCFGRCNLFALAMTDCLGYSINAMITEVDGVIYLDHAFCVVSESIGIDAGGYRPIEEILADYDYEDLIENASEFLLNKSNDIDYPGFQPGEKEKLIAYIKESLEVGQ